MKRLICLVGESGSGKTTLANKLEKELGLKSVNSYTTRPKRYENESGHTFITEQEYQRLNNIVSETVFNGFHYCVTEELLKENDIFVVDVAGVKCLYETLEYPFIVFYLKSNEDNRYRRMINRGDSVDSANSRILHDRKAFVEAEKFSQFIIDADKSIDNMFDEIVTILNTLSGTITCRHTKEELNE